MTAEPTTKTSPLLHVLREHRDVLIDEGVVHLDVFGSVARGETASRDIDICVELREETRPRGFARVGHIQNLRDKLRRIVGRPVDLVVYPVSRPRLREAIERDAIRAF